MKEDFRSIEIAPGKVISIETGRLAKQANGSAVVRLGDTMVIATAVSKTEPRPDQDFFPLSVDFKENFAAAGRFPGGFIKREGRPSEKEILSSRLIDRTIRPMFPEGYMNETQIICYVISSDDENDGDVLGGVAASTALTLSDIPFDSPIAEVRVGRIDGELVINPTVSDLKNSDVDMVVGGTIESVAMVEGEMHELSENEMIEAIQFAHEAIKKLCEFQIELRKEFGKEKREFTAPEPDAELVQKVKDLVGNRFFEVSKQKLEKLEYYAQVDAIAKEVQEKLAEDYPEQEGAIGSICHDIQAETLRNLILDEQFRIDGRSPEDIRPIWTQVGYLPRVHGSAIFTRGETQALVSTTLGTKHDEQSVDTLFDNEAKQFMLQYNFPPFSVGETKPMRGPGRREIGHGHLAERAIRMMMPSHDEFGYVIRVVSDILESNGSSSMATVCGGSMSLMDAGVPLKKPVAGIAMGMIVGEKNTVVLSDIQGQEDHMGDMDFKVCGTAEGITACQMDIKVKGIDYDVMAKALDQAKAGRHYILAKMAESISAPRSELSKYAPAFTRLEIDSDQIGALIGPGGKVVQGIQRETNTEIVIEEEGNKGIVTIAAHNQEDSEAAVKKIRAITGQLEEGTIYEGTVRAVKEYGAFVEIIPGRDGLLHISEIAHERIDKVRDVLKEGDKVMVKLLSIEDGGKLRLSRKAILPKEEETENN